LWLGRDFIHCRSVRNPGCSSMVGDRVYEVQPLLSTVAVFLSGLMVLYPFYLLYWVGESHEENKQPYHCQTAYGVWRIIHLSHLLLWFSVFSGTLACYPRRLLRDIELAEYQYILVGFMIRVPFHYINEVASVGWLPGYVKIAAVSLPMPLLIRPAGGRETFLNEHGELMTKLAPTAMNYGATFLGSSDDIVSTIQAESGLGTSAVGLAAAEKVLLQASTAAMAEAKVAASAQDEFSSMHAQGTGGAAIAAADPGGAMPRFSGAAPNSSANPGLQGLAATHGDAEAGLTPSR